jgi:hypothetical protein
MVEECFDGALRPLTEGFSRPRTPASGVPLATLPAQMGFTKPDYTDARQQRHREVMRRAFACVVPSAVLLYPEI